MFKYCPPPNAHKQIKTDIHYESHMGKYHHFHFRKKMRYIPWLRAGFMDGKNS